MGRNSKDNSLTRYEELVKISIRYNDYLKHPIKLGFASRSNREVARAVKYVNNVKRTLKELAKEDKNIIMKEFFLHKGDPFWWEKHYTKSTYYRRRFYAIKSFMEKYAR